VIAAESQSAKLGVWLFIAADSMFFLGLVGAYLVLRSGQPEIFTAGALSKSLAVMEGALLLIGSAAIATAAICNCRYRLIAALAVSLLAAIGFMAVSAGQIARPSGPPLNGGGPMDAFHACYFTLWTAHALNVLAAMIAILILLVQAIRGKILPAQTQLVAIYWHFLVLLWILLFPILFLTGT
jgi:cytochrome c oxidase subunit III